MVSSQIFKLLDSNEREFDRAYIKLDRLIEDKLDLASDKDKIRAHLKKLNSIFSDTTLKALTAYEKLSRLEVFNYLGFMFLGT